MGSIFFPGAQLIQVSILPQVNGAKCVHFAPGADFYNGGKSICN